MNLTSLEIIASILTIVSFSMNIVQYVLGKKEKGHSDYVADLNKNLHLHDIRQFYSMAFRVNVDAEKALKHLGDGDTAKGVKFIKAAEATSNAVRQCCIIRSEYLGEKDMPLISPWDYDKKNTEQA